MLQLVSDCILSQLQLLFRRVAGCSRSRKRACHVRGLCVAILTAFEDVARVCATRPGPPYSVGDRSITYTNDFNRQTERPNTPGWSPIPKRCMTHTRFLTFGSLPDVWPNPQSEFSEVGHLKNRFFQVRFIFTLGTLGYLLRLPASSCGP